jgi:hypothetical protein
MKATIGLTVFASVLSYVQSYLLAAMLFSVKYTNLYLHLILVNVPKGVIKNDMFTLIYQACRFDIVVINYDKYIGFETHKPNSPNFN